MPEATSQTPRKRQTGVAKRTSDVLEEAKLALQREVELERLRIERLRTEGEIAQRREDGEVEKARLGIEEERVALDRAAAERSFLKSPVVIGALAAFVGLMSNALVAWISADNERKLAENKAVADRLLEREKAESARILEALKTGGDADKAIENLRLLSETRLAPSFEDGLSTYISGLEQRRRETGNPSLGPGIGSGTAVPTSTSALTVFFDLYRSTFGGGRLSRETVENLSSLFEAIRTDARLKDVRKVAYVLATIKHETGSTYEPRTEIITDEKAEQIYGGRMGNSSPGDGARFKGRGYIQLTGRTNYQRVSNVLNIDLVSQPEKALDPEIAYRIASLLMLEGVLTGRSLNDYLTEDGTDYEGARRVVNPDNRAKEIARDAERFENLLRESISVDKLRLQ